MLCFRTSCTHDKIFAKLISFLGQANGYFGIRCYLLHSIVSIHAFVASPETNFAFQIKARGVEKVNDRDSLLRHVWKFIAQFLFLSS